MLALDHALILARDLDLAAATWTRLGFTLTARGHHAELGTANHTIVFPRDYLELLSVAAPTEAAARWTRALERGDHLHGLALATDDAAATHRMLVGRGVAVQAPIRFGREVVTPEGARTARFTVCLLEPAATPAFDAFFCQHHTPELVWRADRQRHANTAVGLVGVTVVRDNPEVDGQAYERLLGSARVHPRPGGITLALGRTQVWLVRPSYAAARLERAAPPPGPLGLSVAVADLGVARRLLASQGVPYRGFGEGAVLVEPTFASGAFLELVAR